MKKFKILYMEKFGSDKIHEKIVCAECEEDALTIFFKHNSGFVTRVEFVGYCE